MRSKLLINSVIICVFLLFTHTVAWSGWFDNGVIEHSMRSIGFKLQKKDTIKIPYSNKSVTRYTFTHRIHRRVIVENYQNGFIEIKSYYRSANRDPNQWNLTTSRVVTNDSFKDTAYNIFVKGEY
jgi:hypothetical protein